jgi:hypothetical protein
MWIAVGGFVVVIVLVLYIALSACGASTDDGNVPKTDRGRDRNWMPPSQVFLESPMSEAPVAGWRITAADLGLTAADNQTRPARVVTSPDPYQSAPFIGNVGDNAYFLSRSLSDKPLWWLTGIDVRTGSRLFAPVAIGYGKTAKCFLNGPDAVLCLSSDAANHTALIVHAATGAIIYTGQTNLTMSSGQLAVEQLGMHAVAIDGDRGVYGIGDRAETTWFVPGDGRPRQGVIGTTDLEPSSLATQTVAGRGADRMVVFSLVDGTVVEPQLSTGTSTRGAAIFPGGFALETKSPESAAFDFLVFFDQSGKEVGRTPLEGTLDTLAMNLPMVTSSSGTTMYSARGYTLAHFAGFEPGYGALMVGSRLFVHQPRPELWRMYDLRTGDEGPSCKRDMTGYIGSDGSVAVFGSGNANAGLSTRAVDLATCTVNWTLTSPPGSFRRVWRINTTLVQLSDDGTELMSLVAPS